MHVWERKDGLIYQSEATEASTKETVTTEGNVTFQQLKEHLRKFKVPYHNK